MKILLAIDDSEYSQAAISEVIKRQWPARSTVRVLSAVESFPPMAVEPWYGGSEGLEKIDTELKKRASNLTKRTVKLLKKKGLRAQSVLRSGSAASEIVDEAEQWPADLIVLGSHGYGALKRLLLGSVALSVVSQAPCSVEVVRSKKRKKPNSGH
jgi:nucleotide-binding universal stress UspA family protein